MKIENPYDVELAEIMIFTDRENDEYREDYEEIVKLTQIHRIEGNLRPLFIGVNDFDQHFRNLATSIRSLGAQISISSHRNRNNEDVVLITLLGASTLEWRISISIDRDYSQALQEMWNLANSDQDIGLVAFEQLCPEIYSISVESVQGNYHFPKELKRWFSKELKIKHPIYAISKLLEIFSNDLNAWEFDFLSITEHVKNHLILSISKKRPRSLCFANQYVNDLSNLESSYQGWNNEPTSRTRQVKSNLVTSTSKLRESLCFVE